MIIHYELMIVFINLNPSFINHGDSGRKKLKFLKWYLFLVCFKFRFEEYKGELVLRLDINAVSVQNVIDALLKWYFFEVFIRFWSSWK